MRRVHYGEMGKAPTTVSNQNYLLCKRGRNSNQVVEETFANLDDQTKSGQVSLRLWIPRPCSKPQRKIWWVVIKGASGELDISQSSVAFLLHDFNKSIRKYYKTCKSKENQYFSNLTNCLSKRRFSVCWIIN